MRISENEYAYRSQAPHRDAGFDTNHLLPDYLLKSFPEVTELETGNRNRADLGKIQYAIARDHQTVKSILIAEQLQLNGVTGPDDVVDRNRNISRRRKCCWLARKQVVTKSMQPRADCIAATTVSLRLAGPVRVLLVVAVTIIDD